jgi:hypothetical protein
MSSVFATTTAGDIGVYGDIDIRDHNCCMDDWQFPNIWID